MLIAIASGKGGTGKTFIATNLARVFNGSVQVLDCDVDAPNDHLFLNGEMISQETVSVPIPEIVVDLCDGCGECARFCAFHALAVIAKQKKVLVFPEMCHGCGGCVRVCSRQAIREVSRPVGTITTTRSHHITLVQGRSNVGVAMVPPIIRAVRRKVDLGVPAIIDAPPGTSCPMVCSVYGAGFMVLVTEPTPFGMHDLQLAVKVARLLEVPCGIVINRADIGDGRVHSYASEQNIPVLAEIPFDRSVAATCAQGRLIVEESPSFRALFERLWETIEVAYVQTAHSVNCECEVQR